MRNKLEIDIEVLDTWMAEQWNLFASQNYRGRPLRLWLNPVGIFRVIHGDKILYEGKEKDLAVAAWDAA